MRAATRNPRRNPRSRTRAGDSVRELSGGEKIGAGVTAGALSGVVCGPIELIMIQQQAKGGGLLETAIKMAQAGPSTFFRGTLAMMAREGIYAGSFLGMMPVMREQFRQTYPDSIGKTEDSARFSAAFLCAPIGGMLSHPPDTVKTCMQGDIEGLKFKGYGATANAVIKERGMSALWAGYPWRCFRQLVALVMFDKIQSELVPKLFPHAFARHAWSDADRGHAERGHAPSGLTVPCGPARMHAAALWLWSWLWLALALALGWALKREGRAWFRVQACPRPATPRLPATRPPSRPRKARRSHPSAKQRGEGGDLLAAFSARRVRRFRHTREGMRECAARDGKVMLHAAGRDSRISAHVCTTAVYAVYAAQSCAMSCCTYLLVS